MIFTYFYPSTCNDLFSYVIVLKMLVFPTKCLSVLSIFMREIITSVKTRYFLCSPSISFYVFCIENLCFCDLKNLMVREHPIIIGGGGGGGRRP